MDKITLHDKRFKVCTTAAQIDEAVEKVAAQLNKDMANVDTPIFLSVLNGSFMFTADLVRKINFQSDVVFIKVASYDGTSSTGFIVFMVWITS